ncbi:CHAT domain-containing protein [Bradyrhizobium sp. LA6.10]
MKLFYEEFSSIELGKGDTAADALRRAQLRAIRDNATLAQPLCWAAFAVTEAGR